MLKGDRAKIVGAMWCQKLLEPEDDISRWLSSLVVGAVDFRKKIDKNRDRCPVLPWWADFCAAVNASGIKIVPPKKQHCLVRTMDVLEFQYAPTIAIIAEVLGAAFEPYIEQLLQSGKERMSSRHRAIIGLAMAE